MKLFVLLLTSALLLPACSKNSPAVPEAAIESDPQTSVYISSRAADPVADRTVIVAEAQPDPSPAPMVQPRAHRRAQKRQPMKAARQHAPVHSEHGSFHNSTPD